MYKYTLIVSQYYHTWHQFIVEHDENFLENAKNMARELIDYKRDKDSTKEEYLGDLNYEFSSDNIRRRYNINDSGDIYFINYETIQEALSYYKHHILEEVSWKKGYKKKAVLEAIDAHHNYPYVKSIIKKHFNIL